MPKLRKADYARELCRHRRSLRLYTEDDHFNHLTVPQMIALLKKFSTKTYKWVKRDYVDWIILVRVRHHLPVSRECWELYTVKALRAEKDRITTGLVECCEEEEKREAA